MTVTTLFPCTPRPLPPDNCLISHRRLHVKPARIDHKQVRRIMRAYKRASNDGQGWYHRAYTACERISRQSGRPVEVVAAVIAALSPACKWERNLQDARALCTGDKVKCQTYKANVVKARRILAGESSERVLGGRKVRTFLGLILHPWRGDVVCIDRHAKAIAGEDRLLTDYRYRCVEAAYLWAARKLGALPCQVQAVTWVDWRETAPF